MKSTIGKRTAILGFILLLIIGGIGTVSGYVYGSVSARGEQVKQYLITEDIEVGHSLQGKYVESYMSSNNTIDLNNLVLNANDLDSSVASVKLYKNSPITKTDVKKIENIDRYIEVSFPVTVTGSVANSVKPGDVVSVKLTYKDQSKADAVVIPQITIKDVKSTSGTPVTDANTVVGYVIFEVSNDESSDVNNAMKEGDLYCAKYTDLNQSPLDKTYTVSGDLTKASTEGTEKTEATN